jgi:hypothetical protein
MTAPQGNEVASPSRPGNPAIQWIVDNPFLCAAAVYLAIKGIQFVVATPDNSEWDNVFVYAGKLLLNGGDLYGTPPTQFQLNHPYTYPPFHAMLGIPFSFLQHFWSRVGWFLLSAVSLITIWKVGWKIAGGSALNRGGWTPSEALICILGVICGMRYIDGALGHQQSDILIDALLVSGCFAWQKRRDFLAATAWGLAAAFKGPPLILAPYLAWRGRWAAAAWMVVLTVALNLVPDLIHRAPHDIWLQQWYTRVIQPKNGQIGAWYVDVTINQSIAGAALRFFTTHWAIVNNQLAVTFDKHILAPKTLKLLVYGFEAMLALLAAWALWPPFRRPSGEHVAGLECALVFILMLLFSPMSHKTHFGILILPGFFVARMAVVERNRLAIIGIAICLIVIGVLDHFVFYNAVGDMFAWYGNIMWGTFALGMVCFWALLKERNKHRLIHETEI